MSQDETPFRPNPSAGPQDLAKGAHAPLQVARAQNTSTAVMQQRHEALDSLDDFPTAPWATRAAIRQIVIPAMRSGPFLSDPQEASVWEPCCNRGHMARPLAEVFGRVDTSDVHDYSADPLPAIWRGPTPETGSPFCQDRVADFLLPGSDWWVNDGDAVDWIFFNPPFRLAEAFIHRALEIARQGVAVFARQSFVEGRARYDGLFKKRPPTIFAPFVDRVILHKGVLRDPSKEYWDPSANKGAGGWKRPSTATSYGWFFWMKGRDPMPPVWIDARREDFERPGDYPINPDERGAQPEPEGSLL